MTRKDFIKLAQIMGRFQREETSEREMFEGLLEVLQLANPRFDAELFRATMQTKGEVK